ncbi:hypothetical protein BIV57_01890 [Mangrovactinospora gilvigrisea]|uniref:Uncharacterized protein n=1 Tax=Mangrovactinospora gilvigrisea TaxID=1428644 RepID=A0A1J7CCJ7_9ACTN|nr:hypothetical protein [Mangrovactinospora gilvigrisea]OIV39260.1 hypothetical protein BIV57_01890 [Mangrovactinospora gilvigrisea]
MTRRHHLRRLSAAALAALAVGAASPAHAAPAPNGSAPPGATTLAGASRLTGPDPVTSRQSAAPGTTLYWRVHLTRGQFLDVRPEARLPAGYPIGDHDVFAVRLLDADLDPLPCTGDATVPLSPGSTAGGNSATLDLSCVGPTATAAGDYYIAASLAHPDARALAPARRWRAALTVDFALGGTPRADTASPFDPGTPPAARRDESRTPAPATDLWPPAAALLAALALGYAAMATLQRRAKRKKRGDA